MNVDVIEAVKVLRDEFEPFAVDVSDELKDRFRYHAPSEAGRATHEVLTMTITTAAAIVNEVVPNGREKSLALTKLEEAKFWASAGVARNPETR